MLLDLDQQEGACVGCWERYFILVVDVDVERER